MGISGLGRQALGVGLAVGFFAGCGGAPNTMPNQTLQAQSRAHRASGSSGELLYVTTRRVVYMLSYPEGKVVGSFHEGPHHGHFICSDPSDGSVFITDAFLIRKFAHGGTQPIAVLHMPGRYGANGCAVDATTGNIAIAATNENGTGALVVFKKADKTWAQYPLSGGVCISVTYDNDGDIFTTCKNSHARSAIRELASGQTRVTNLTLRPKAAFYPYTLHWDGSNLTAGSGTSGIIYSLDIHGRIAKVVGSTELNGASGYYAYWIQNDSVLAWDSQTLRTGGVGVWNYPAGGSPTKIFNGVGTKSLWDLAVSVAPSR